MFFSRSSGSSEFKKKYNELSIDLMLAARWMREADGLLITSGAGMGVDSGLPDFRGDNGFWKAYPALEKANLDFMAIASPSMFETDPSLAWGFYGHRLKLYRDTIPHQGFNQLLNFGQTKKHGSFVFTSNVDGQFQKAGFSENQICECHGSIHYLQCLSNCNGSIWDASSLQPTIDIVHCRLLSDLPKCPHCDSLARPNIMMFGDWKWEESRTRQQEKSILEWMKNLNNPLCIEMGAGSAIPTVRFFSERHGKRVIRINPRESAVPPSLEHVSLPMKAKEGVQALMDALSDG
ncbi:MAG TPA: Sir2 family NAD-dependent protein deacetylase [Ignavibacteriaceae bacterium]